MKKNFYVFTVALFLVLLTVGCSSQKTSEGSNNKNGEGENVSVDYPVKNVTLTVPFSAGDTTDLISRTFSEFAGEHLGKNFIVVNKAGAGGSIGHSEVSREAADGYSILLGSSGALTIAPYMRDVGYTYEDFEPIGLMAENPITIVVNKNSEFNTLEEFIAYAKENPGLLEYGTPGAGVTQHIMMERMASEYHFEITHIPHEGGNNAVAAVLGGHIDAAVVGANLVIEQVKSGELKALGLSAPYTVLPDVPTFVEQGYNISTTVWFGLFVPKGTPDNVKAILTDTLKKASEDPTVISQWDSFNVNHRFIGPDELKERIEEDAEGNRKIIEALGLAN